MEGLVQMVYVPGMSPMVSKEQGNAHFRVMMSQAAAAVGDVASARVGVWL